MFCSLFAFFYLQSCLRRLRQLCVCRAHPNNTPHLLFSPLFYFFGQSLGNSVMDAAKDSHRELIKDRFPSFTSQSRSITERPCACETVSTPGSCSLPLHYCLRCVVKTVDGIPEIKALGFQQH